MTSPPLGVTCLIPPEVTASWVERHQQIYSGETLCGLLVPWVHGDLLEGRDLLWFVDNEAAVSSLIKGSSGQSDVHTIYCPVGSPCFPTAPDSAVDRVDRFRQQPV